MIRLLTYTKKSRKSATNCKVTFSNHDVTSHMTLYQHDCPSTHTTITIVGVKSKNVINFHFVFNIPSSYVGVGENFFYDAL